MSSQIAAYKEEAASNTEEDEDGTNNHQRRMRMMDEETACTEDERKENEAATRGNGNNETKQGSLSALVDNDANNSFNPFGDHSIEQPSRFQVLSTKTPIPGFHPTQATIRDRRTGKIYDWNSRSHRKMRSPTATDDQRKQHLARIWTFEPHIVTWWLNLTNEIANVRIPSNQ